MEAVTAARDAARAAAFRIARARALADDLPQVVYRLGPEPVRYLVRGWGDVPPSPGAVRCFTVQPTADEDPCPTCGGPLYRGARDCSTDCAAERLGLQAPGW